MTCQRKWRGIELYACRRTENYKALLLLDFIKAIKIMQYKCIRSRDDSVGLTLMQNTNFRANFISLLTR